MRLLDLFCGAGGAGMGYHLAGFEVVGVDIAPQPHYPFEFHQADAFAYAPEHWQEFDVIHASPPCQAYSVETAEAYKALHPRLIAPIRKLLRATGKPYVIENVMGARRQLHNPIMFCGSMFGLRVWRHRYFEIYPESHLFLLPPCDHSGVPVLVTGTPRRRGYPRKDAPADLRREAIGIDWMVTRELDEAIPPAYTEFIGRHLLAHVG